MRPPTSIGITRRIQSLYAFGYNAQHIAQATQINPGTIEAIAYETITETTGRVQQAICDAWLTMQIVPGPSRAASIKARHAHGWAVPFAWDIDGTDLDGSASRHWIDDPKAWPDTTGACGTRQGRDRHQRNQTPVCDACREATRQEAAARRKAGTPEEAAQRRAIANQRRAESRARRKAT